MKDNDPEKKTNVPSTKTFSEATAIVSGVAATAAGIYDPTAGLAAAGLAPFLSNRLNDLYASRLTKAVSKINDHPALSEQVIGSDPNASLKVDLIREYLTASLGTDSDEKLELLWGVLDFGISSNLDFETMFARRIVRTLSRVDEIEIVVLGAIMKIGRTSKDVDIHKLIEMISINDMNIVRSSISVLVSEGLILRIGNDSEKYRITDYGSNIVSHLRDAHR